MDDQTVTRIITFAVAESLPCGNAMVDGLGKLMQVEMADHCSPDQTFFDLLRDKQAINAMVKEVAGKAAADANITETAKSQKAVIQGCITGARKPHKPDWQPRYMAFPMQGYTKQGGIRAVEDWDAVKRHYK